MKKNEKTNIGIESKCIFLLKDTLQMQIYKLGWPEWWQPKKILIIEKKMNEHKNDNMIIS